MPFASIDDAVRRIRAGKPIIIMDRPNRENEGDMFIPAQRATKGIINFMLTYARGKICVPLTRQRTEELNIPLMHQDQGYKGCKFTVTVDYRSVTSGVAASDRCTTIRALAAPASRPQDFRRPGHTEPLMAETLETRHGHTEAAVALAQFAGYAPAGVICEMLKPNGEMARLAYLGKFAEEHGILMITIEDLLKYAGKSPSR